MAAKTNGTVDSDYKLRPLGEYAIQSSDAESFVALVDAEYAKAGKTPNYSLSANGPADLYYDLMHTYIGDRARYDDGDASYAVLNAVWLYVGRDQASFDSYKAARVEANGKGAAERLAKAREKAQKENKAQAGLIELLAKQLGLTAEQVAEMKASVAES